MQFRRLGLVLVALLIVLASLAGCVAASDMAWPDREITTDVDTALAAQDMGMAGLMMGSVTWTEAEFSSFLTYLTKQNTGGALPLDEIKVWFEAGNQVFIELTPTAGGMIAALAVGCAYPPAPPKRWRWCASRRLTCRTCRQTLRWRIFN